MRTTASRSRAPRRILLAAVLTAAAISPAAASATTYSAATQSTPATTATLDTSGCLPGTPTACYATGSSGPAGSYRAAILTASPTAVSNYILNYPFPGSTAANLVSESPLGATCEVSPCVTVGWSIRTGTGFDGVNPRANWGAGPWSGTWAPAGAVSSRLRAVSCTSTTNCVAVGDYTDASSVTRGYALVKTSTTSTVATTVPGSGSSTLNGIECETVGGKCTIIGTQAGAPIIKTIDPATSTWATPTVTGLASTATLKSISCKAHRCFIVGSVTGGGVTAAYVFGGHFAYTSPYAESWNTTGVTQLTLPAGASGSVLNSVTCVSDSQCRAVGGVTSSGVTSPYSASFLAPGGGSTPGDTAGTWSGHSNAVGAGLTGGTLNATSCGVSFCLDAGTATTATGTAPIAARVAVTD